MLSREAANTNSVKNLWIDLTGVRTHDIPNDVIFHEISSRLDYYNMKIQISNSSFCYLNYNVGGFSKRTIIPLKNVLNQTAVRYLNLHIIIIQP
jgi:hypothetical protein